MKKLIIIAIVAVFVLFAGVNLLGNIFLARVLENALGVKVDVKKVELGLFTRNAGIYGLRIHNPEGFKEKIMASIPEIAVRYDLSGILKKKLILREVRLNLAEITVERGAHGVNLLELKPMKPPAGEEGGAEEGGGEAPAPPETAGKKTEPPVEVVIDEVTLSLGQARYVDSGKDPYTAREIQIGMKDEVLRDVNNPAELIQQIVFKVLQRVGLNALLPDLGQLQAAFGGQAAAKLEELKEGINSFFNKIATSN